MKKIGKLEGRKSFLLKRYPLKLFLPFNIFKINTFTAKITNFRIAHASPLPQNGPRDCP